MKCLRCKQDGDRDLVGSWSYEAVFCDPCGEALNRLIEGFIQNAAEDAVAKERARCQTIAELAASVNRSMGECYATIDVLTAVERSYSVAEHFSETAQQCEAIAACIQDPEETRYSMMRRLKK